MAKTTVKAELTPTQATAVDVLGPGGTLEDAIQAAAVPRAELRTWLTSDAVFVAAVRSRQNEAREDQVARLRGLASKAVDTLEALLEDPAPAVRLRAASMILKACGFDSGGWVQLTQDTPEAVRGEWNSKSRMAALLGY